ncbi:hypothetical protein [Nostoc sp. 'Peltigera membranacea cyanobiont' N6]|uniref:hypothetical protein n=1 Tax=Nostoc sp. 'Peltigera membranacea cyanobiont' N6 TaxID=1261031 RepID=UPI0015E2EA5F|nr:hypothetical protein [Nostoc sp. 'Peltigera membranacea cyanobiont' N6]
MLVTPKGDSRSLSLSSLAQFRSGGMMYIIRLVADMFYDNGQEFIQFTNRKEILVETAWRS